MKFVSYALRTSTSTWGCRSDISFLALDFSLVAVEREREREMAVAWTMEGVGWLVGGVWLMGLGCGGWVRFIVFLWFDY